MPDDALPARHDIVVVGASMGGIEALRALAGQLPADFPAAVLVAVHTAANSPGTLAEILDRAGPLPAAFARDGEPVCPGRLYVAPPDFHLLLTDHGVRLSGSARENRARPAIDPLFRSAAVAYRSRVVGVVLTGLLDDGAAGLRAVERCGGVAVVQDPSDAAFPDMPEAALIAVPDARRTAVGDLGALLGDLVALPASRPPAIPPALLVEAQITERGMSHIETMDRIGERAPVTCPDCGGTLWLLDGDGPPRYRCHTGHAYTERVLFTAQTEATEQALMVALRTLEERARMLRRMAGEAGGDGYAGSAAETERHAEAIRTVLVQSRG